MPKRRFDWGRPYLLTDLKEGVFRNELGVCVYKHDADKEHPNMCAVCGETLGSKDYYTFCLKIPGGGTKDMMIGTGCIRDRIRGEEADVEIGYSPKETLDLATTEFPQSGRWYGTFLHHCIAKPYVRNKENAENWDETILKLPGVRYIMDTIDELRDSGWKLDAEMVLDCGNVDLLATHPEKGTIVFDWKSDLSFDNHEAYIKQINRYMAELYTAGWQKISGYILWVRDRKREYVPFKDVSEITGEIKPRQYVPSQRIKCTLTVDMDGGEKICSKTITEYSHHRTYGDEVFFYIPPCDPWKYGYVFDSFEASPYREEDRPQWFNASDAEEGLRLNFMCSKKRHKFTLTARWKERPVPNIAARTYTPINTATSVKPPKIKKPNQEPKPEQKPSPPQPAPGSWEAFYKSLEEHPLPVHKEEETTIEPAEIICFPELTPHPEITRTRDPAELSFTPSRIYASGGRYYGIYKRTEAKKANTCGMVDVAEVDYSGRKVSKLEWRHIYRTPRGKEYIYSPTNHEWKIYTSNVLSGLSPEGMDMYGRNNYGGDSQ
ncbi:hypothetical protein [Candidatus Methanarcanum hacksteinii]|uniref:hypothetical protein n=1 Tax=Candidatus Methanarcanum hacksteinii TaxID=2911857 RepID=UPI0037DDE168